nr:MAG TPA: Sodium/potassium-transporting ATPase subunit alpha-1 [Caudoviricetes sp.]
MLFLRRKTKNIFLHFPTSSYEILQILRIFLRIFLVNILIIIILSECRKCRKKKCHFLKKLCFYKKIVHFRIF